MAGSDITIRTGDGTPFQAYLAGDTPSRPAVIMFTPIFGVDADAKAIADRWADRGYLVAVPDYYFRQAPGVLDRSESGRKSAMERWKALNVDRAVSDMRGLADYLLARPSCNGRLAALGFCAGGELAFLAATRLGATAVATFHATHIDRHFSVSDATKFRNSPGVLSIVVPPRLPSWVLTFRIPREKPFPALMSRLQSHHGNDPWT